MKLAISIWCLGQIFNISSLFLSARRPFFSFGAALYVKVIVQDIEGHGMASKNVSVGRTLVPSSTSSRLSTIRAMLRSATGKNLNMVMAILLCHMAGSAKWTFLMRHSEINIGSAYSSSFVFLGCSPTWPRSCAMLGLLEACARENKNLLPILDGCIPVGLAQDTFHGL